ncbi:hypothetical protein HMPREF9144_1213 [Prevotella pallens ATCC 700821]|uniref:Uncharacterized protein n=1 Tax=Prevotella pallens ATCC 700821 TaxID=997353 RepID=F9DHS3_9BACT|nr:hypothetical protein HMPREF9144_1213 [Prevotella pallens ATCC 700821]
MKCSFILLFFIYLFYANAAFYFGAKLLISINIHKPYKSIFAISMLYGPILNRFKQLYFHF